MGELISIADYSPVDQILRKGDVVRVVRFEDSDVELSGIVIEVDQCYGPDTDAPGQASIFSVGIPLEGEWVVLEDVSLLDIVRVIGHEHYEFKSQAKHLIHD